MTWRDTVAAHMASPPKHGGLGAPPTDVYKEARSAQTEAYRDNVGGTEAYRDDHGSPPTEAYTGGRARSRSDMQDELSVGTEVKLPCGSVTVEQVISPDRATGEAAVYLVGDSRGHHYAFKLYRRFGDARDEPNPVALERIQKIQDPDILRLHAFGTGRDRYDGRCWELSAFAEGGTLLDIKDPGAKYTPDFIRNCVVPQILNGIQNLHKHQIIHCDLKPQNIFYLDSDQLDLVIGDYGSAKTAEEGSKKDVSYTSTNKGTQLYIAPEQPMGLIGEGNDYHAFGMILVHLLFPKMLNKSEYGKIRERQFNKKPIIIESSAGDKDIVQLIGGLTLHDKSVRWGAAEVQRWLAGENVPVRYGNEAAVDPIKLGQDRTIQSPSDLLDYVETKPDWYETLIADDVGFTSLKKWVSQTRDLAQMRDFDKRVRTCQQDGKEYVQVAILRFFEPERPIVVDGRRYDLWGAENLLVEVTRLVRHLDDLWKIAPLAQLRFHVFQLEMSLRQLAAIDGRGDDAKQICGLIETALQTVGSWYASLSQEQVLELAYAFMPDRGFRDGKGTECRDLETLGLYFARTPGAYEEQWLVVERHRFLRQLNRADFRGMDYRTFLFGVFRERICCGLELQEVKQNFVGYEVLFRAGRSLTGFFTSRGITNKLFEVSQKPESAVVANRNLWLASRFSGRALARQLEAEVVGVVGDVHRLGVSTLDVASRRAFQRDLFKFARSATRPFRVAAFATLAVIAVVSGIIVASSISAGSRDREIDRRLKVVEQASLQQNWTAALEELDSLMGQFKSDLLANKAGGRFGGLALTACRSVLGKKWDSASPSTAFNEVIGHGSCESVRGSMREDVAERVFAMGTQPSALDRAGDAAVREAIAHFRASPRSIDQSRWLDLAMLCRGGQWTASGSQSKSGEVGMIFKDKYNISVRAVDVNWSPPASARFAFEYTLHGETHGVNVFCAPSLFANGREYKPVDRSCSRFTADNQTLRNEFTYGLQPAALLTTTMRFDAYSDLSFMLRVAANSPDPPSSCTDVVPLTDFRTVSQRRSAPTHVDRPTSGLAGRGAGSAQPGVSAGAVDPAELQGAWTGNLQGGGQIKLIVEDVSGRMVQAMAATKTADGQFDTLKMRGSLDGRSLVFQADDGSHLSVRHRGAGARQVLAGTWQTKGGQKLSWTGRK